MISYPIEGLPEPGRSIEVADGVHWLRMPLPMALDHINLYLIEDEDGWLIVDTGIALGPTESLWEEVFTHVLADKPVKAVICTHFHPDHTGMAGWLCERWRVPFYMSWAEYYSGVNFSRLTPEDFSWTHEQHMARIGYSPDQIEQARKHFGGFGAYIKPMPKAFRRLQEGDSQLINGRRWRVIVGRGHSPEHACLYCEALNLMISGDQLIPRITSNISVNANEPEANPLRDWLQSLERLLEVVPDDTFILPAHNEPFYGAHARIRQLIEHHEEHLLAIEEACAASPGTVMDMLPVLFKRNLDAQQVGMAVGECIAHLNYLLGRGQLSRKIDEHGVYRYYSVDETLPQRLRQRSPEAADEGPLQV
ncbi:MAG: MBL fold metallo-hydrolase [Pseudomonadota bacterium]